MAGYKRRSRIRMLVWRKRGIKHKGREEVEEEQAAVKGTER
jgi:hypothetical protein